MSQTWVRQGDGSRVLGQTGGRFFCLGQSWFCRQWVERIGRFLDFEDELTF
ncbi:MAG TPA: hypothetical protein GXX37_03560 [Clostridiaceae bacterium]|nr:hypothetical protein [Clostridiaceae bacterium]